MANKIFNLETVTNINEVPFHVAGPNGGDVDAIAQACKIPAPGADKLTLFSFNVKTGKASPETHVMPSERIKPTFVQAMARAWYESQYKAMFAIEETLPAMSDELSEQEKKALTAIRERCDFVREVREKYRADAPKPCKTVNNIVAAFSKSNFDRFSEDVRDAYSDVEHFLKSTRNKDTQDISLKALKPYVLNVSKAAWDESEHCERLFFTITNTDVRRVFQLDYRGLAHDSKSERYTATYNKSSVPLREIILAAWNHHIDKEYTTTPDGSSAPNDKKSGNK